MMRGLFSGVSGLKNHQTRMDVIANNIANVNTAGFKGSRVTFQDILSQSLSAASSPQGDRGGTNPQQIGLGMGLSSIDTNFNNGSIQATGKNTDLCISNAGFFILGAGNTKSYSRSGAFEFDTEGNYGVPGSGLHVQGWMADELGNINTSGQVGDIKVQKGQTMPAKATDSVSYGKNLSAEAKYATTNVKETYKYTDQAPKPAIGDPSTPYGGQLTNGKVTNVTESKWDITYRGSFSETILPTGADLISSTETEWSLKASGVVITVTPPIVGADLGNGYIVQGVNPTGNLNEYTVTLEKVVTTIKPTNPPATNDTPPTGYTLTGVVDGVINGAPSKWMAVREKVSADAGNKPSIGTPLPGFAGYEVFKTEASKWDITCEATSKHRTQPGEAAGETTLASGVVQTLTLDPATVKTTKVTAYDSQGVKHELDVNFTKIDDNEWTVTGNAETSTGYPIQGLNYTLKFNEDGTLLSVDPTDSPISFSPGQAAPVSIKMDFSAITQFAGETTAQVSEYTGYPAGSLNGVDIDSAGTLIGKFTNGKTQNLAQVALATFNNPAGLTKDGNSLYSESNNSGVPQISTANNGGAGSLTPNSLEMSNVDVSEEFSNMIVTQRGFQSNSKIITVSDEMLETLMSMKR